MSHRLLILFILLSFFNCWAQSPILERRAKLNYEDELVEGSTQKPELFYLFQKKNFNYGKLIKLRENFIPEMKKTTEDLQRIRSSN